MDKKTKLTKNHKYLQYKNVCKFTGVKYRNRKAFNNYDDAKKYCDTKKNHFLQSKKKLEGKPILLSKNYKKVKLKLR